MNIKIVKYEEKHQNAWDAFVLKNSINGTFLQSKNFLNYHPADRFKDDSLMFFKGENSLVAVMPGCSTEDEGKKIFFSHKGSTFGGIIIDESAYDTCSTQFIIKLFEEYLIENNYKKVVLKQTSNLFSRSSPDLIEYLLFKNDYSSYTELSFYIDCQQLADRVEDSFSQSRRRDYRYSLKNSLSFHVAETQEDLEAFHNILVENLKKFGKTPVHSLAELLDFKFERLKDVTSCYLVKHNNVPIAGSFVFTFDSQVFHTQYLAALPEYLNLFPMEFLNRNLIAEAKEQGFKYFSFGISTENNGKHLNEGLAKFKEGFGTAYSLNKTFIKEF